MRKGQRFEGEKKYGWGLTRFGLGLRRKHHGCGKRLEETFETVWSRRPRQRDHDDGNKKRCCQVVSLEFRQVAKQSLLGLQGLCTPAVRSEWTYRNSVLLSPSLLGNFGQVLQPFRTWCNSLPGRAVGIFASPPQSWRWQVRSCL